jgi:hypothetical protein
LSSQTQRERYRDEKIPELYLEIVPSETQVFQKIKWLDGRAEPVRIRTCPSTQPEDARNRTLTSGTSFIWLF